MECPRCGSKQINGNANFCVKCGAKLRPVCNCWVLKKDNYTCGEVAKKALKEDMRFVQRIRE